MIDIESELKRVQVQYIKAELKKLKDCYYDEHADVEYDYMTHSYTEMIENAITLDEQLILYKQYYQSAVDYLFRSIQDNTPQDTEYVEVGDEIDTEETPF